MTKEAASESKRAYWQGTLRIGLVRIPVKLYAVTRDPEPLFRQLHAACASPVQSRRYCGTCDREIAFDEIVKGRQVADGQYAVFSMKELAELVVEPEGEKLVDVTKFFALDVYEPSFASRSYCVAPASSGDSLDLLTMSLDAEGAVALAVANLRSGRSHSVVLRPSGGDGQFDRDRLILDVLRTKDEILFPPTRPARTKKKYGHEARELIRTFFADAFKTEDLVTDDVRAEAIDDATDEKIEAGDVVSDGTSAAYLFRKTAARKRVGGLRR